MKVFKIPKKNGKFRVIYAPNKKEKLLLSENMNDLNMAQIVLTSEDHVHGFINGRNVVTCAKPHVGFQYTLSVDLSDFFDTVTQKKFESRLGQLKTILEIKHKHIVFCDAAARQGLMSSPSISNITATRLDEVLIEYCDSKGIVYTRYADDLSFSSNDKDTLLSLREDIKGMVEVCEFTLNEKKTRLQWGGPDGNWTREIVGVGVNKTSVIPLRNSKRKLRAAKHNLVMHPNNKRQETIVRGLEEWNKLKEPNAKISKWQALAYFIAKRLK